MIVEAWKKHDTDISIFFMCSRRIKILSTLVLKYNVLKLLLKIHWLFQALSCWGYLTESNSLNNFLQLTNYLNFILAHIVKILKKWFQYLHKEVFVFCLKC